MSIGTPTMWLLFVVFVIVALLVDFFAMNKQGAHRVSMREATIWSVIWVAVSFAFVGWLWWYLGGLGADPDARSVANSKSLEFITGYLVEKALAVDNIFVFLMVFTYFGVPAEFQKRVLMIGILGALVLRAILILVGAWLLARCLGSGLERLALAAQTPHHFAGTAPAPDAHVDARGNRRCATGEHQARTRHHALFFQPH